MIILFFSVFSVMVIDYKVISNYLKIPAFIVHELSHILWLKIFGIDYEIGTLYYSRKKHGMSMRFNATLYQILIINYAPLWTYLTLSIICIITNNILFLIIYTILGRRTCFPSSTDAKYFNDTLRTLKNRFKSNLLTTKKTNK